MQNEKVHILLASYNGEMFIEEQIDSILAQTHVNWILTIRDDGSTDSTVKVISKYLNDPRVNIIISDNKVQGSAQTNFSVLLDFAKTSDAAYYAFSDQDDIWLPNKISTQLSLIGKHNSSSPLLVHSDLEVVNQKLETIHPSFMSFQKISHHSYNQFEKLLSQNFVTGCTCLFNRSLLEQCLPINNRHLMHDWWLALNAAAFGDIIFDKTINIKYRQHDNNSVGAKGFYSQINPFGKAFYSKYKESKANFHAMKMQVKVLNSLLLEQNNVNMALVNKVNDFLTLCEGTLWEKIVRLRKLTLYRNFGPYWLFLCWLIFVEEK